MNFKQEELTRDFFQTVRENFPEVELTDITPSPEDPNDLWISVTAPSDEEREFSLMDMASGRNGNRVFPKSPVSFSPVFSRRNI